MNYTTAEMKYTESLKKHIYFVVQAGRMIGVNESQLAIHDNSKWTEHEFPYYAAFYHGDDKENPVVADGYAYAWLHHVHNNPHHWQHWMFPDNHVPRNSSVENGVVRMPNWFAIEMIADWMGSSMAYTGSWDMQDWLYKNMPRIHLHSETADFVRGALDGLGYADTVYAQKFGHEK